MTVNHLPGLCAKCDHGFDVYTDEVGSIALVEHTEIDAANRNLVALLKVPEAHRGNGYGESLLLNIMEQYDELWLEPLGNSPDDTHWLIEWYERLGFTRVRDTGYWVK